MNVFFDIETICSQSAEVRAELAAAVTAPGQFKKPESIAEWLRENRDAEAEKAWLQTSFDGGLGQIVCIAWACDDGPVECVTALDLSLDAEHSMLSTWFNAMRSMHGGGQGTRPCLIGHNSNAFDIPFVWKRAMVLGVKPPLWFPRDPKPWGESTYDTMVAWAGQRERISMERLCRIFGIDGKGGMDGSQVWPMVRDGRLAEVAAYCRGDVERTRRIYKRMTFATPLAAAALVANRPTPQAPTAPAALPASLFG